MKSRNCFLELLLIAWLVLIGCSSAVKEPLQIEGEATRGVYSSFSSAGSSQIEFLVNIDAKNISGRSLNFDKVVGVFLTASGRFLPIVTVKNEEGLSNMLGFDSKNAEEVKTTFSLAANKSYRHEYATNGFTFDLLRDGLRQPIRFLILFELDNEIVAGPYCAQLPSIKELPSEFLKFQDKNAKRCELVFSKISLTRR